MSLTISTSTGPTTEWLIRIIGGACRSVADIPSVIRGLLSKWGRSMKIAALLAIVAAVYKMYRAYRTLPRALDLARNRSARLIAAWMLGRTLEASVYCPLAPAGSGKGVSWTTTAEGLEQVTPSRKRVTQPLVAGSSRVYHGPTMWQQETLRSGDNLTIKLRPLYDWTRTYQPMQDQRDLVHGEWASRKEMTGDGVISSHARCGEYASATLNPRTEAAVHAALCVHGAKTQAYSVGTVLRSVDPGSWKDDAETTMASQILADMWAGRWPRTLAQVARPAQSLQKLGDTRDCLTDPYGGTGVLVGPEMCEVSDAAPMTGRSNDLVAIHDRLDSVRNLIQCFPAEYATYAEEFTTAVVGGSTGLSLPVDHVLEEQNGPLQRVRNAAARAFVTMRQGPFQVKAFLKKEPIVNSGPVRNISTLPAETNLKLGRICLTVSAYLKRNTSWYCAGVQPPEVARRIVAAATGEQRLMASDISKMDACKHVAITAMLCHRIAVRLLPADLEEITELHYAEATCSARTASGEAYCVGGSQLSGSATTTLHNTVCNAWLSYCAYRQEGKTPADAYLAVDRGLFVGDDSVSHNTSATIEQVGKDLGYVIKAEVLPRGAEVPFLSRWFPAPWDGEPGSYQDPVRLLRKVPLSFGDQARGQRQLAADKWRGLSQLDPAVSVYTVGASALQRITGCVGEPGEADQPWFIRESGAGAGWPQLWDADRFFEMRTGVAAERLVKWFLELTTWEAFLEGPGVKANNPSTPKRPAVDPTAAFTPPPAIPVLAPPPCATSTHTQKLERKEVDARVKDSAEAIKKVSGQERRLAATKRTKVAGPFPVGTWKADSRSSLSSTKSGGSRKGKRNVGN